MVTLVLIMGNLKSCCTIGNGFPRGLAR